MEQTQTQAPVISLSAPNWTRLAATSVAHMTEHVYIGIVTVALPVIAASMVAATMATAVDR